MNLSGTKINTVIIDDEWTEWAPAKKAEPAPPVYLDFNTPPLALVLAMQDAGKDGCEIYATLQGVGKSKINTENVVTIEHQKRAAAIYDYFAKKHTMRRIKGEWISEYMLAVDDLCENRKKINPKNFTVLISLPRIYKQNRSLERLMKGHKSAPKPDDLHYPAMEGEIEFVEKIHIKHRGKNEVHYYFSTPNNYLMRIVTKKGEYGESAWNVLANAGKLNISTDATFVMSITGYDFNVIQPTPDMEIEIIND